MPKVICLGEAVIDLFASPVGVPLKEASSFVPSPGGAPANVAVALSRLGIEVGFIGRVGDDPFGLLLIELLQSEGVNTTYFRSVVGSPTTVAFVAASSPNEQDFILYRGADTKLRPEDLSRPYIASAEIFLYGSVTLTDASRGAALQAVSWANEDGVLVAYDANLRPALWQSLQAARYGILEGMRDVTVCKLNETELELLAGTSDLEAGSRWILNQGPRLCLITLGPRGAYFNNGRAEGYVPAFSVKAVDSTGCGDAFFAGLVFGILETGLPPEALDESTLRHLVHFANAAGALTATRQGAMAALPTRMEVESFLQRASTSSEGWTE
ncbi:MAG TPA: carbohydrate kinase [Anaerolineae bacterium]|nr:carbohydrate kinase [Anaerolineae bacterium]